LQRPRVLVPQPAEWQRVGNQIHAAFIPSRHASLHRKTPQAAFIAFGLFMKTAACCLVFLICAACGGESQKEETKIERTIPFSEAC